MHKYLDKIASLTPNAKNIICNKATEQPYTGAYNKVIANGSYLCRRCGLALFRANSQFQSSCGWPSFDDFNLKINGTGVVKEAPDPDGQRIEILCQRCDAHLGHVFRGENLTVKNCRYCVNAASLDFVLDNNVVDTEEAILAGGCFWGVEHFLRLLPGVLKVEVGYTGGKLLNPSYLQVCRGDTRHYEAARVVYDVASTNYAAVIKRFFEIHDPTQSSGQGPDLGSQYKSAIFYYNDEQLKTVQLLIKELKEHGYAAVTQVLPAQIFWPAEEEHQNYYAKHQALPYCHRRESRFG